LKVEDSVKSYADASPFSVTRAVKWGECDPAGIIYTPRVLDYALEIVEAWFREVVGVPWLTLNREMAMGAPTVRAELDFLDAPHPDQDIVIDLRVESLGRSSITFLVTGGGETGREFFRVKLVSCFISRPAFKPIAIPGEFRECILAYQKACDPRSG
jgi:4-hydroxybenzoyl-CoA thioesterase